jgi:hypothetical protein
MFSEIFNGLLARKALEATKIDLIKTSEAADWLSKNDLSKPDIRVGVIPGGSTDAVAMSLHGTDDVTTATLHILLGKFVCFFVVSLRVSIFIKLFFFKFDKISPFFEKKSKFLKNQFIPKNPT